MRCAPLLGFGLGERKKYTKGFILPPPSALQSSVGCNKSCKYILFSLFYRDTYTHSHAATCIRTCAHTGPTVPCSNPPPPNELKSGTELGLGTVCFHSHYTSKTLQGGFSLLGIVRLDKCDESTLKLPITDECLRTFILASFWLWPLYPTVHIAQFKVV